MFIPVKGKESSSFKDSTLIIPCHSAGLSAFIGLDLLILNEGLQKLGYLKSDYIVPGLSNDGLALTLEEEGNLVMPAEIYQGNGMTLLMLRSGVLPGKMREFGKELARFWREGGFKNVVVLSSTLSPVQRERNSNRL